MRAIRRLSILAILLVATGCAGAPISADPAGAGRSRTRSTLLTFEEMRQRGQFSSLYNLIQELRPRWLRSQGPDSLVGFQGQVQVRMDGNHLGDVNVLRNLSAHGVTSIHWLPPIDAAARYGLNHGHGAIIISTAVIH